MTYSVWFKLFRYEYIFFSETKQNKTPETKLTGPSL